MAEAVTDAGTIEAAALAAWRDTDATRKAARTRQLAAAVAGAVADGTWTFTPPPGMDSEPAPGRPCLPRLVAPQSVPRRRLRSAAGHAALIHALCHIEFTAINLALDAALRFAGLPPDYYRDWLVVAGEEATHFTWLAAHLATLGQVYGDFPAHDGLWRIASATATDLLARMALVPRVLEARGLDVTPAMVARLEAVGDSRGAAILRRILDDEIGHVAIGSRWFAYAANAAGVDAEATFRQLLIDGPGRVASGPLNVAARTRAGFSDADLSAVAAAAATSLDESMAGIS